MKVEAIKFNATLNREELEFILKVLIIAHRTLSKEIKSDNEIKSNILDSLKIENLISVLGPVLGFPDSYKDFMSEIYPNS